MGWFFLLLSDFNLALNSDRESLSMQPNFSIKRGCNLTSLLHRVFKKVQFHLLPLDISCLVLDAGYYQVLQNMASLGVNLSDTAAGLLAAE